MKSHLCEASQNVPSNVDVPELTADEENVIRYAAGYVPYNYLRSMKNVHQILQLQLLSVYPQWL